MGTMSHRPIVLLGAIVVASATISGCARSQQRSTIERWFDTAREHIAQADPDSDVMQIDPSATCALVDDLAVDGRSLELFGAGVAMLGAVGDRYQCAWSGDVTMSANARLEIEVFDSAPDFAHQVEVIPTRAGNTVVATGIGDVQVTMDPPPGSAGPVTTAILVVPDQQGLVTMVVEPLDPATSDTWSPTAAADLLDEIAG